MIQPSFLSPAERRELVSCMRSQREDHGIARSANAILLLDDGKSRQAIAEFLYLDDDTIRGWYRTYREAGWDAISFDGWKGVQSHMTADQEAALCGWLEDRFCRSTVDAVKALTSKPCFDVIDALEVGDAVKATFQCWSSASMRARTIDLAARPASSAYAASR